MVFACVFAVSAYLLIDYYIGSRREAQNYEELSQQVDRPTRPLPGDEDFGQDDSPLDTQVHYVTVLNSKTGEYVSVLPQYADLFSINPDFAGWLQIPGTDIDYPVMQTPEDEQYYLYRDFYSEENRNGSLIMDTDSTVGIGCEAQDYVGGTSPSTNLIIHGHNMKSGLMFGKLDLYEEEAYGKAHNIICFDSLYEKREYELISVFRSQVYKKSDKVFKYYQFFQADTEEEFHTWYLNIKEMALYDTGVTAQFGDEFITLSCCSEHVEDGRLVVVGKRVK